MRISSLTECLRSCAFFEAISTEIAMSPAKPRTNTGAGNDNTSVARSAPLKRRFKARSSRLSVTINVTIPRNRAARQAAATNAVSSRRPNPGTRRFKMMVGCISFVQNNPLKTKEGNIAPSCSTEFLFRFPAQLVSHAHIRCHDIPICGPLRIQQIHLVLREFGFMLVVGADDSLNQVMPYHV